MEGTSSISTDVLASYAADSAREVPGVAGIVASAQHRHRGVKVSRAGDAIAVELRLSVDWGADVPELGGAVQQRVAEYLSRMVGAWPCTVDVVVDEVGQPAATAAS